MSTLMNMFFHFEQVPASSSTTRSISASPLLDQSHILPLRPPHPHPLLPRGVTPPRTSLSVPPASSTHPATIVDASRTTLPTVHDVNYMASSSNPSAPTLNPGTAASSPPPIAPSPTTAQPTPPPHPMITRHQASIIQPNQKYADIVSSVPSPPPTSIHTAMSDPDWLAAMCK
jgi:hypothetical protein